MFVASLTVFINFIRYTLPTEGVKQVKVFAFNVTFSIKSWTLTVMRAHDAMFSDNFADIATLG